MPSYKGLQMKNFKRLDGLEGDGLYADVFLHGEKVGVFRNDGFGGNAVTTFERKEDEEAAMQILYELAKRNPSEMFMSLYQKRQDLYEQEVERIKKYFPYLEGEITMEVASAFNMEYLAYELLQLTNLEMFFMEDILNDGYRAMSVTKDGEMTGYPEEWTDEQIKEAAKGDRLFMSLQDFYME